MLHYCIPLPEMLQLTFYYKGKDIGKQLTLVTLKEKKNQTKNQNKPKQKTWKV